jgi:hypothetical protein
MLALHDKVLAWHGCVAEVDTLVAPALKALKVNLPLLLECIACEFFESAGNNCLKSYTVGYAPECFV